MSRAASRVLVVEVRGVHLVDLLAGGADTLPWRTLVAEGAVRVNGQPCVTNRRLRVGDVVQCPESPPAAVAPEPVVLPTVLLETQHGLVVDKPPGLPCVPDRSGADRGLHGQLDRLRPGADLRIVHRLDRDTSGCLLLAKGIAAARHYDAEFRAHRVRKTYCALVDGVPAQSEFVVDAWLGPDPRRPGKVVVGAEGRRGFRAARTLVAVERTFQRHALLRLQPETGRGHQLRVHLASQGHPIVGDTDYGGSRLLLSSLKSGYKLRPGVVEKPLLARMFLHAARLSFVDLDGQPVAAEAPLAADLAMVLEKLERFDDRRS